MKITVNTGRLRAALEEFEAHCYNAYYSYSLGMACILSSEGFILGISDGWWDHDYKVKVPLIMEVQEKGAIFIFITDILPAVKDPSANCKDDLVIATDGQKFVSLKSNSLNKRILAYPTKTLEPVIKSALDSLSRRGTVYILPSRKGKDC